MSFTTLLSAPQEDTTIVHRVTVPPLIEDKGRYRVYALFPIEEGRPFEVYTIEIDGGGSLSAEPHPERTEEFVTVFAGALTMEFNEQQYRVVEGDAIRFRADRPHRYRNTGETMVKLGMVIHYPG
ncbi:MAG TPA: cupin domain-containing protein [Anaerolineae bacterium]